MRCRRRMRPRPSDRTRARNGVPRRPDSRHSRGRRPVRMRIGSCRCSRAPDNARRHTRRPRRGSPRRVRTRERSGLSRRRSASRVRGSPHWKCSRRALGNDHRPRTRRATHRGPRHHTARRTGPPCRPARPGTPHRSNTRHGSGPSLRKSDRARSPCRPRMPARSGTRPRRERRPCRHCRPSDRCTPARAHRTSVGRHSRAGTSATRPDRTGGKRPSVVRRPTPRRCIGRTAGPGACRRRRNHHSTPRRGTGGPCGKARRRAARRHRGRCIGTPLRKGSRAFHSGEAARRTLGRCRSAHCRRTRNRCDTPADTRLRRHRIAPPADRPRPWHSPPPTPPRPRPRTSLPRCFHRDRPGVRRRPDRPGDLRDPRRPPPPTSRHRRCNRTQPPRRPPTMRAQPAWKEIVARSSCASVDVERKPQGLIRPVERRDFQAAERAADAAVSAGRTAFHPDVDDVAAW